MSILEKKEPEVAPPKPDVDRDQDAKPTSREQGHGVQKLLEVIREGGGRPAPGPVIEVFDNYPNEHSALMKVAQRHLGNAFVDSIVPQMKLTQRHQNLPE